MKGYGIGLLRDVRMGPEIREYLERIDELLEGVDADHVATEVLN